MSEDLQTLRERLDACRDDLQDILAGEAAYVLSHVRIRRFSVMNPPPGQRVRKWYCRIDAPVPTTLSRRVGMLSNELRTILEALVGKLALRNGADDVKSVSFPIYAKKVDFDARHSKAIKQLSDDDRKAIVALEPFSEGNLVLAQLAAVDNMRKHEDLVRCIPDRRAVEQSTALFVINPGGSFAVLNNTVVPTDGTDTLIGWAVNCEGDFAFVPKMGFSEPEIAKGELVVDFLDRAIGEVTRIVGLFDEG